MNNSRELRWCDDLLILHQNLVITSLDKYISYEVFAVSGDHNVKVLGSDLNDLLAHNTYDPNMMHVHLPRIAEYHWHRQVTSQVIDYDGRINLDVAQ